MRLEGFVKRDFMWAVSGVLDALCRALNAALQHLKSYLLDPKI